MPYRRPGSRRSSVQATSPSRTFQKDYGTAQTGTWRHQFASSIDFSGVTAGVFAKQELLRFKRTFSGSVDDTAPTPTASNNYQTFNVFNGSKIRNFEAKFTIKNASSSAAFELDVYTIALSFYDCLVWETIIDANCPVTMTVSAGASDDRGTVTFKTPTATLITRNSYANYKIIQHYMKKVGTLHLSASDGSPDNTGVFTLRGLPAKVRRAQTGMFYGIVFVNDSDANGAGTMVGTDATAEISFDEIPSENRLPWLT